MQYKQATRFVIEIIRSPVASVRVVLAATRLLSRGKPLPSLRRYPKRTAAQALWRSASSSASHPEVRWKALRRLLVLIARNIHYSETVLVECEP